MYNTGSYRSIKPKQKKSGTILFTLSALLVAGMVGWYVSQLLAKAQPTNRQATIKILVAAKDISLGRSLTAQDMKLIEWPAENASFRSSTSLESALGRVVLRPLVKGEAIAEERLAPLEAGQGLGALIPKGMRAQALKVSEESGVAGFVKPGDFVDIVTILREEQGVVSRTALQNIQVLAVGDQYQSDASSNSKKIPVVTVLLQPAQAEHLALASTNGETVLTLRNGYDTELVATNGFSGANVDISQPTQPEEKVQPKVSTTEKVASNTKQPNPKTKTPDEKTTTETTETKTEEPQMPQVIIGGKIVSDSKNNKNKIVIVPMPKS